jgi:hypothetical protein
MSNSFKIKIIGFIVLILAIAFGIERYINYKNPTYKINMSSQTVIKQIRSLNRLETSTYTIEKIIDVGTSGSKFSQFLYGDRILLIAHGEVVAGFDLGKLNEDDINVSGDTLRVTMPSPEILVTKLDSEQTRVYDRQQGLLTKGDENLESEARTEAEKVIKDAACKGGILEDASKNARNQLTGLFKSLGFVTVIIETPQGRC